MADLLFGFFLALSLGIAGVATRSFDIWGGLAGIALGVTIVWGVGTRGFLLVVLFVVLASAATRMGMQVKERRGVAQGRSGRRSALHALVKIGVPAACAFLSGMASRQIATLPIAYAASVAAALADTLATEVGQVCSAHPFLLMARKPVAVGTPGAVSLPGLVASILGVVMTAIAACLLGVVPWGKLWVLACSALVANVVETVLGEISPKTPLLTNPVRNLALTTSAAAAAILFGFL